MVPFSIRLANRSDEPAIQHVIRTVYDEYGWPWDPEDYHQDLYNIDTAYFDKGGMFWVGELDGEVVGTTALEIFPAFPDGDTLVMVNGALRGAGCDCSLERLYLLASARGQGIGRKLLQHTIDSAKSAGCSRMEIWSDKKLVEAHALYEKIGAKRIGDRLCHDPDQSPEWGMILDLR
jgi:putative acetyltransferase